MADSGHGLLAGRCSGAWEAPARGKNGEEAEGVSGRCSPASERPYAGRNLAGDEMAGGSSVGGGVRRCRGNKD
jgi:hypothetical protein